MSGYDEVSGVKSTPVCQEEHKNIPYENMKKSQKFKKMSYIKEKFDAIEKRFSDLDYIKRNIEELRELIVWNELMEKIDSMQENISDINKKVVPQRCENEELEGLIKQYYKEISESGDDDVDIIKKLVYIINVWKNRVSDLREKLTSANNSIQSTNSTIEKLNQEKENLQSTIKDNNNRINILAQNVEDKNNQISQLKQDKESLQGTIKDNNNRINILAQNVEDKNNQISQLKQDKESLQSTIRDNNNKINILAQDVEDKNNRISQLKQEKGDLQSTINNKDDKIYRLTQNVEDKDNQISRLNQDKENLQGEVRSKDIEIEKLSEDIDNKDNQIQSLQIDKNALDASIAPFIKIAKLVYKCPSMNYLINEELHLTSAGLSDIRNIIVFINRFSWNFDFARLVYKSMQMYKENNPDEGITEDEMNLIQAVNEYYKEMYGDNFAEFDALDCMNIHNEEKIFDRQTMQIIKDPRKTDVLKAVKLYVPALRMMNGKQVEKKAIVAGDR